MALLCPGRNCRKIEQADRVAFLVDGAAYFSAMRAAFIQAKHSIFILCWDIDTRVRMIRGPETDGHPPELGDFLRNLLFRRPNLHINILAWDFHMIYAFERQWWTLLPFRLGTNRRLRLHMDDTHPLLACHHQKLIVVDDNLAMVGGFDPTQNRWDTSEHRAHDPRRVDPDVACYPPFHDVELMVDGPVAAALGRLARDRWQRATGNKVEPPKTPAAESAWPAGVKPDLSHVPIAIALTQPAFNGESEAREIERLILDSIGCARRYIYLESQYLTSESVAGAIMSRLRESRGPEVVIILHPSSSGWLEHHTMDVLRGRILRGMRAADRHGRLGVYYPQIPGLGLRCMTMHSKVMIVDGEFVRIGSANLSNRSMGFDTECDLALEAEQDESRRQAIIGLLHRLVGEHLGVDPAIVSERMAVSGSLLKMVEGLRGKERTLRIYEDDVSAEIDALVPDASLIDPDRPLEPEFLIDDFEIDQPRPAKRQFIGVLVLLFALLGLAAAWQWSPLRTRLSVPELADYLSGFRYSAMGPVVVLAGYLLGGLLVMPVTLLIAATVLAFGGWLGFAYSFAGILASAALTYGIGHVLGQTGVRRFAGARLNRLSSRLAQRGIVAVLAVRVIPVAPFSIVNLVAGASQIRFRDFLLGTIIGMLPGLAGMTVFMDRFIQTLRDPGPIGISVMVGVAAALLGAAVWLRRWLEKRTSA